MRIRFATLLGTTLVFCLVFGPVGRMAAAATVVAYTFSGTITSVSDAMTTATGVVLGETVTGTFSYDYTQTGTGGVYTFTGSSKVHTLAFKIYNPSGQQIFSDQYTGNATLQSAGYYAAKVSYTSGTAYLDLVGDSIYKQGLGQTFYNTGIPAYDLTLKYPSATGFSPTFLPLPNTTVITKFVSSMGRFTWDPDGQSFTADITSFNGVTVPEPSGLLLATIGLSTCAAGCALARRRRAAARQFDRTAARP